MSITFADWGKAPALAGIIFAMTLAGGCKKVADAADPYADGAQFQMTGPDGPKVSAEMVPTKNGMRMRVREDGKVSAIEMEFPEGFNDPQRALYPEGEPDYMKHRAANPRADTAPPFEELDRRHEAGMKAMRERFEADQRDFDRRSKKDRKLRRPEIGDAETNAVQQEGGE